MNRLALLVCGALACSADQAKSHAENVIGAGVYQADLTECRALAKSSDAGTADERWSIYETCAEKADTKAGAK